MGQHIETCFVYAKPTRHRTLVREEPFSVKLHRAIRGVPAFPVRKRKSLLEELVKESFLTVVRVSELHSSPA